MAILRICSVEGCDKRHKARGFCRIHYRRLMRNGTTELIPKKSKGVCLVEGCNSTVNARGLCNKHYPRFRRYGDPKKCSHEHHTVEALALIETAVSSHKKGCLFWPFSRTESGYALFRKKRVHRIVCEKVHGPAPEGKPLALHACGRGSDGCFSPCCLYWGDNHDNQADRLRHGTSNRGERHGNSSLTSDEVQMIRRLKGQKKQVEIARVFGVGVAAIRAIHTNRTWKWLKPVN